MGWKKILFKDFSEFLDVFVETQPCVVDCVGILSYAYGACCTYFGSGQAVMQMITTSNKLSILFLLKGKTILYQSFVRILLA